MFVPLVEMFEPPEFTWVTICILYMHRHPYKCRAVFTRWCTAVVWGIVLHQRRTNNDSVQKFQIITTWNMSLKNTLVFKYTSPKYVIYNRYTKQSSILPVVLWSFYCRMASGSLLCFADVYLKDQDQVSTASSESHEYFHQSLCGKIVHWLSHFLTNIC